jgi:prepilin-type N-terminal cleavage/methylation domain-containing protein
MRRRGGFTLIELLIVIAIIAVLATVLLPRVAGVMENANVSACQANLRNFGQDLQLYRNRFKELPNASGPAFLLKLWETGMVEHVEKESLRFLCPGVGQSPSRNEAGAAYDDIENVDPETIDYAGRNVQDHPISRAGASKEALAADDNDGTEPNHKFKTNVLWADLSVTDFDIATYPGLDVLVVGPDSPEPALQTLSAR